MFWSWGLIHSYDIKGTRNSKDKVHVKEARSDYIQVAVRAGLSWGKARSPDGHVIMWMGRSVVYNHVGQDSGDGVVSYYT